MIEKIYWEIGNKGIEDVEEIEDIGVEENEEMIEFEKEKNIEIVVVGKEEKIVEGIEDEMRDEGIRVLGK